jgi:hypothetical protein
MDTPKVDPKKYNAFIYIYIYIYNVNIGKDSMFSIEFLIASIVNSPLIHEHVIHITTFFTPNESTFYYYYLFTIKTRK